MRQYDRPRRRFAVILAGLAGFVDAVGFMSANGYFVSFMSGNTTRLGVSLGTDPARAITPALLIFGFLCGVTCGALLAFRAGRYRKPVVLTLVTALLLAASVARSMEAPLTMLAALVAAMGVLNNTFQRGGEVTIGLTYMTGALVRLGQGMASRIAGLSTPGWTWWAALWIGLLAGGAAGAFLQDRLPLGCLWIATFWAAIMAVVAVRHPADS